MADIIIAFPKLDDAENLRKLLVRNGYDVNMVCDSGAQIVSAVNSLDGWNSYIRIQIFRYALFRR